MAEQSFLYIYALEPVDGSPGVYTLLLDEDGLPYTQPSPYVIHSGSDEVLRVDEDFVISADIDFGPPIGVVHHEHVGTHLGVTPEGPVHVSFGQYSLFSDTPRESMPLTATVAPETYEVACFLAGTLIATPDGERAIETLAPGDLVLTHDGRAAPVKWLWTQTVSLLFADRLRVAPVRVRAGALGPSLPARDLLVSTDHGLLVDGALVQAGALVNGRTITRETDLAERFCYFHLELEDHSLILAEGVPAETFLDAVGRRAFDNWRAYEALHGQPAAMAEMDLPRVKSARQARRAA